MALRVCSALLPLCILLASAALVRAEEPLTPETPAQEAGGPPLEPAEEPLARRQASEVERAEALADAAYQAYSRGDYRQAVDVYLQAYDVVPTGDMLYNVARIYDVKLGERTRAADYYRRYTTEIDAEPGRVRIANERLRALHALQTSEESGQRADVRAPRAPLNGMLIGGITLLALGTGGIALGAGSGIVAMREADVAKASCDGNRCRSERGLTAADEGNRAALISTVSWAAGGALAAAGAILLTLGSRQRKQREQLAVSVLVGAPLGGALTGRW